MKTVVVTVVLALAATAVHAHEGMHGPGSEYDEDEDGSLSLEEYKSYLKISKQDESKAAEMFAALDSNKDGRLSSPEFARGLRPAK